MHSQTGKAATTIGLTFSPSLKSFTPSATMDERWQKMSSYGNSSDITDKTKACVSIKGEIP
jgi:hypothetical protein